MDATRKKSPAPAAPISKSQWPNGTTYRPNAKTFEEFARENFVSGTPIKFVRKELKKPLLVYTPEKERDDVIKVWRILIRYMGDIVDYRTNLHHDSHQPELGSVMTRLCRQLGQATGQNPFGPSPVKAGELHLNDESLQMLPNKPKLGTLRKLKNTIALRLFGKGRKSVFQFLPLEETLLSDLDKIQYIIGYSILRPRIRDEMYCGLCRQLIGNPYKVSIEKGWVLMNLMAASFVPSERCFDSIVRFLESGPKIFAASAKRLLLKTRQTGERLHPPSQLEYNAVLKKTPLELEVKLMDGNSVSLPADGTTSSFEIVSAVASKLRLHSSFGFHLYITNRTKVSSLGGNDHILDSIAQLEQISRDYTLNEEDSAWHLYLRKEVFESWEDFSADSVATNLIYAQLKRGVLLQEYNFPNKDDLPVFLAKICYIEKGAQLNEEYLENEIIPSAYWHIASPNEYPDQEAEDDEQMDETVVQSLTENIKTAFENLYNTETDSKPNTYNVKLELISNARQEWASVFSHSFDISVVIDTGDVLDGVLRVCVHSHGISLQGDDEMIVDDVGFVEIMQLAEERNEEEIHPHSIVLKLLDGRDLVIVSQDAADIRDMISYLLLGLTERSTYAVAITQKTSSTVDDLDLEIGDLLVIDRVNSDEYPAENNFATVSAKNIRTGQIGRVNELMYHILPTLTEPEERILRSYKERSAWVIE